MASIRYSELVSEIRGSAGGVVFSRNANGAYVRNRVKGVGGSGPAQSAQRAVMAGLSTAWRDLTDLNRTSWVNGAPSFPYTNRLGESKQYTGQQLFMSLNMNLKSILLPQIDVCPIPEAVVQGLGSDLILYDDAGTLQTLSLTFPILLGAKAVFFASSPQSAGRNRFAAGGMKKIYTAGVTGAVNLTTAYQSVFGNVSLYTGNKIFVSVHFVNALTGQTSAKQRLIFTSVPA